MKAGRAEILTLVKPRKAGLQGGLVSSTSYKSRDLGRNLVNPPVYSLFRKTDFAKMQLQPQCCQQFLPCSFNSLGIKSSCRDMIKNQIGDTLRAAIPLPSALVPLSLSLPTAVDSAMDRWLLCFLLPSSSPLTHSLPLTRALCSLLPSLLSLFLCVSIYLASFSVSLSERALQAVKGMI